MRCCIVNLRKHALAHSSTAINTENSWGHLIGHPHSGSESRDVCGLVTMGSELTQRNPCMRGCKVLAQSCGVGWSRERSAS